MPVGTGVFQAGMKAEGGDVRDDGLQGTQCGSDWCIKEEHQERCPKETCHTVLGLGVEQFQGYPKNSIG